MKYVPSRTHDHLPVEALSPNIATAAMLVMTSVRVFGLTSLSVIALSS